MLLKNAEEASSDSEQPASTPPQVSMRAARAFPTTSWNRKENNRGGDKRMKDLAIIETILRNRHHFFVEIRDGVGMGEKMRAMVISSILFLAMYGAVMGSTHSLWQTLSSAVKLPVLFLATLVVCSPTLIVVFFLLTTSNYQFFKLMNVMIFAICAIVGVVFLSQGMKIVSTAGKEGTTARRWLIWLWVIVYAFVGSQMAWTLRPFIGAPSMEFELFRQLGGNFYTNVFASIGEILGFFVVQ
jgi:hypothetical protein